MSKLNTPWSLDADAVRDNTGRIVVETINCGETFAEEIVKCVNGYADLEAEIKQADSDVEHYGRLADERQKRRGMTCRTCRWCEKTSGDGCPPEREYGDCKKYAPKFLVHYDETARWPQVRLDTGWCGEWEARAEKAEAERDKD